MRIRKDYRQHAISNTQASEKDKYMKTKTLSQQLEENTEYGLVSLYYQAEIIVKREELDKEINRLRREYKADTEPAIAILLAAIADEITLGDPPFLRTLAVQNVTAMLTEPLPTGGEEFRK